MPAHPVLILHVEEKVSYDSRFLNHSDPSRFCGESLTKRKMRLSSYAVYFSEGSGTMDVLSGLSDDQLALLLCVGAFMVCGLMMSLSYYLGVDKRNEAELRILSEQQDQSAEPQRKAA